MDQIKKDFEFKEEIDLRLILRTILRNKKLIIYFSLIIALFTFLTKSREDPIFSGSFNIVTDEQKENNSSILAIPNLTALSGGIKEGNNRQQSLILKSESVLMPVFNFVKKNYQENGIKTPNLTFNKWLKKELEIEYEKNTNVLMVTYKNKDKKLILETLNLISSKYQDYSKSINQNNINNKIDYLTNQRKIMRENYNKSFNEFNLFAIENRFSDVDVFLELENGEQIKTVNEIALPSDDSNNRFKSKFMLLEKLETDYADYSARLKPTSKYLKNLEYKINSLKESLKRPNEILVKHKFLQQKLKRDESILAVVDIKLEEAKLEKVRSKNPWKLISTPKVENKKISPLIFNSTLINFIVSIIFGSLFAVFKTNISGKIYELKILKELLNIQFLDSIDLSNKNLTKKQFSNFLKDESSSNKSLGIIKYLSDKTNLLNTFDQKNLELSLIDINKEDFEKEFDSIIIIIESGFITRKDILLINKYNNLIGNKIKGWFFTGPSNYLL